MNSRFFRSVFVGAVLFPWCGVGFASSLCTDRSPAAVAQALGIDLGEEGERRDDRPNVLIIVVDDLGYADLGSWGGPVPTPNIDRIAEEGAKFTEGYVTSPVCSPSRAGVMTGKQQNTFGYERNLLEEQLSAPSHGLPLSEKTIADYFKERGYATGFVGKWHLGDAKGHAPQNRGYGDYWHYSHALHGWHNYQYYRYEKRISHNPGASLPRLLETCSWRERHLTDAEGLAATSFILRHRDQPFLLYYSPHAVHWPFQNRSESLLTYISYYRHLGYFRHAFDRTRRWYLKMLIQLDQAVGHILDTLDLLGLAENTVVWFFSDNGGNRALRADNGRLRGTKGVVYEGGIRVPFMVRWPRVVSPAVHEWPVSTLDVLPTSLAAAGHRSEDAFLDGINLLPYLKKKAVPPPRDFYWRFAAQKAVRSGDWKLVSRAVRAGEHGRETHDELFNLRQDAAERNDLSEEEPEMLRSLQKKLTAWSDALPEALW